jgi:hypothetical protein
MTFSTIITLHQKRSTTYFNSDNLRIPSQQQNPKTDKDIVTHLDSCRIVPFAMPAFCTHGTKAKETDRTITLTHLDTVENLRRQTKRHSYYGK